MNTLGPWEKCDPEALAKAFDEPDFATSVRMLFDLCPRASSGDVAKLPWEQRVTAKEIKAIRDAWKADRAAQKHADAQEEPANLADELWERVRALISIGDLKGAKEAFDLRARVSAMAADAQPASAGAEEEADDFKRLSDVEVLMLDALCHKLRNEPLTEADTSMLEYVAKLDPNAPETAGAT